jgi:hypothetical protein
VNIYKNIQQRIIMKIEEYGQRDSPTKLFLLLRHQRLNCSCLLFTVIRQDGGGAQAELILQSLGVSEIRLKEKSICVIILNYFWHK